MPRYPITPVPKPRQTRSDRWKKRPCVLRYREFADIVRSYGVDIPEEAPHIIFYIPMPASWNKKKKEKFFLKPHRQKPDIDNLFKALSDALYRNDAHIWDVWIQKRWAYEGAIEIKSWR